jgi:hypothetical protein
LPFARITDNLEQGKRCARRMVAKAARKWLSDQEMHRFIDQREG